jgi:hypothetical protein
LQIRADARRAVTAQQHERLAPPASTNAGARLRDCRKRFGSRAQVQRLGRRRWFRHPANALDASKNFLPVVLTINN